MNGYYDYHPSFFLRRPVALYGAPGTETAATGYALSALSGLPFIDVDRRVEHALGRNLKQALGSLTGRELLNEYKNVIGQSLSEMPHGIWATSNLIVDYPPLQKLLAQQTDAVVLQKSIFNLYHELQREQEAYPPRNPELNRYRSESARAYKNFVDNIEQGYPRAVLHVNADNRSPNGIAQEILQWLQAQGTADLQEQLPPLPVSRIRKWLKF